MDLDLYIDMQGRRLANADGSTASLPNLVQGDSVRLVLHGIKKNPDTSTSFQQWIDDPIVFSGIKCGISPAADAAPPAGTFRVRLVGNANLVNGVPQETADLPYGVTQADFAVAVNGLSSVTAIDAAGIKLDAQTPQAPNFFYIRWNNSAITAQFEIVENRLEPLCFVRSSVLALPKGQLQMLKFFVAPYAFTDQFTDPALAPVTVDLVRSGTGARNCVQAIGVPENSSGSFSPSFLTNTGEIISISALTGTQDGSALIADSLNDIYPDGKIRFSVTKQFPGVYYVEFIGLLEKQDFALLGVTMHGQEPLGTPVAPLPVDGPSFELALHGQKKIDLLFELEITSGDEVVTPVQVPVTILNDMIDAPMAMAAGPNWLAQIDPTYPSYNPEGATIVGYRSYITPIGNSVGATSFVITHNLGTQNCVVTVRDTGTHRKIPDVQYVTTYLSDSQIQIDFAGVPNFEWSAPPTAGEFYVIILSAIAQDLALPHHTHPISDIDGLQDLLDALNGANNPLDLWPNIPDAKLPTHIGWRNQDTAKTLRFDVLPDELAPVDMAKLDPTGRLFLEELPIGVPYVDGSGQLVVTLPGPPPVTVVILDATGHAPIGVLPVDPSQWPGLGTAIIAALQAGAALPAGFIPMIIAPFKESYPPTYTFRGTELAASLPRALINATDLGNITGALPDPYSPRNGGTALGNSLYHVVDGASAEPVKYRPGRNFFHGDLVGCDGQQWFKVFADGANAYPTEMERDLFTVHVAANMFPNGSRFACAGVIYLSLDGPCSLTTRGRYLLRIQSGVVVGAAINSITWDATPLLETAIILSTASTGHAFSYSLTKAANGTTTGEARLYGNVIGTGKPTSEGDFVLRAVLTQFDLEDLTGARGGVAPQGLVHRELQNPVASIAKLTA